MKTYNASTIRSWIKILAYMCVTHAMLFQGVDAACADTVSPGDQGVGISAIDDTSCRSGGVGCFADVCRYCKTRDTIQSANFVQCPTFVASPRSVPAPVPAAAAPTGVCAATVPIDDKDVGISAYDDASCKNGGVGCFGSSTCRYCKIKESSQASQFVVCPSSTTSASTTTTTLTITTSAPATVTCASLVSTKNADLGFSATSDAACVTGNAGGCFQHTNAGACRYCKTKDTDATKDFQACPGTVVPTTPTVVTPTPASTVDACAATVSIGDKGVGISAVADATCATRGGVGCRANDVCRFCKIKESSQASQFLWCSSFTPATSAPTLATPIIATPTITTSAPATVTCASLVSTKNADLGFSATLDAACVTGNAGGCFQHTNAGACRYCKTKDTDATKDFQACPGTVVLATPSPAPSSNTPAVSTPAASTPAATALTDPVVTQGCKKTVSLGDVQQGISMVTDETCATGLAADNTGCNDNCRFCKTKDTTVSSFMHPCSEFPVIPITVQTPAPNYCSPAVTSAQALSGIWANVECTEWYKGACYKATCPLCQFYATTASASLPKCVTPPGPLPTSTPAPGAPAPNLCTEAILSETQLSLGISAMWDQSCTTADKDCVTACRFCQFYATVDSAPYKLCSTITPLPPPPQYVAPAPGVVEPSLPAVNECSKQKWTAENEAAGIWTNAQCYETDAAGLCISVVCSPCSFYNTEKSFKYPACVNGVFSFWPDMSTTPATMMASVRGSAPSKDSTSVSASLSSSVRGAIAAAAAVGIVALFVVMVFGAKRMNERDTEASPAPASILTEDFSDESGVVQQQSHARRQQSTQCKGRALHNPASA